MLFHKILRKPKVRDRMKKIKKKKKLKKKAM